MKYEGKVDGFPSEVHVKNKSQVNKTYLKGM